MNEPLPLLSDTNIARRNDPRSSHDGDRQVTGSGKRSEQQLKALVYVREHPGLTPRELSEVAEKAGDKTMPHEVFHKRLPEMSADHDRKGNAKIALVKRGRKRVCKISGALATPWYEAGYDIPPEQQEIDL